MRFTFPQAVVEPSSLKPPVPQPGLPPPHGINSHFGPGPNLGKPQSTNYSVATGNFHQSGSPLGSSSGSTGEGYGLSPLRPPSVLPPPAPDGSLPYPPHGASQRAGITSPVDKREDPGAGMASSLAAPELPGTQDPGISTLSQTELEKQRQVSQHRGAEPPISLLSLCQLYDWSRTDLLLISVLCTAPATAGASDSAADPAQHPAAREGNSCGSCRSSGAPGQLGC